MRYIKSEKYDSPIIRGKIMGPNPLKLQEELLTGHKIPPGAVVLDLDVGFNNPGIIRHEFEFLFMMISYTAFMKQRKNKTNRVYHVLRIKEVMRKFLKIIVQY
jgi:hypothetical protein